MVTLDKAAALALALPEVIESETRGWRCWVVPGQKPAGKSFAWERPFSKADVKRFGDDPVPDGPILAVRIADLGEKEAVLADHPDSHFTIPHFEGYAAILVQLKRVRVPVLRETLLDGWLACAPPALIEQYYPTR